ncbi:hypothetical protein ACIQ4I_04650 [Rummeliibacillus sp. NPDC094406]|uniref:hypothetical protein n=1 Tax=Rummeliibacillus sp. NPDC094406 TaxID=3364511 RepID=UPI0037F1B753
MSKTKVGFSVLLIIVLAFTGFYYANALKTESLANDILKNVNFDKVKADFVYDRQTDIIQDFDKNESEKIMQIFKKVELKGVIKTPKTKNDYLVYVGGSGGSFQFEVSDDGFVRLDKTLSKYYKFVDKKLLDDLLKIIKKQYP